MEQLGQRTDAAKTGQEILGYLNFSSGAPDPRFLRNINHLFEVIDACPERVEPTWKAMHRFLAKTLQELHGRGEAFRQIDQAEAVLGLVFDKTLPGYRQFHADLLFHQTEETPVPAVFYRPGLRSRAAAGRAMGRNRSHRPRRDCPIERLSRPPAGRRAPHAAENPALRPRMGAADPACSSAGRAWPWAAITT